MLAGDSQARKLRERRVSNLSIGVLDADNATPKISAKTQQQKQPNKAAAAQPQGAKPDDEKKAKGERRSLFRTSIADDSI